MPKNIYLDNQSTTQIDSDVLEAMLPYFSEKFGNASSSEHIFGWESNEGIEQARATIANSINAKPEDIIFTSGATESNNMLIRGLIDYSANQPIHVITTETEHKCILEALKKNSPFIEFTIIPVTPEGVVEVGAIRNAIRKNTVLISVIFANNEIGSINPIKEIGEICLEHFIAFHTDAAQAMGKISINVDEYHIDFLSASAHKIYGPKGVGLLYMRRTKGKNKITPLMFGGGQENGIRSGTLNTPGIIGFAKAIKKSEEEFDHRFWKYLKLRNHLYHSLIERFSFIQLNGASIESIDGIKIKIQFCP